MIMLLEIERSYIRVASTNLKRSRPRPYCARTCDYNNTDDFLASLQECLGRFDNDCLNPDRKLLDEYAPRQVAKTDLTKVFLSGSIGTRTKEIVALLKARYGEDIIDAASTKIDPEILGAFGAAHWAKISHNFTYLRHAESWDQRVMRMAYQGEL